MQQSSLHRAVFFYQKKSIGLQLLVEEFESVLDGFAPLPDFSSQRVEAVYTEIRADQSIESAVFFCIDFDATGLPDPSWNVPFEQLSRQASPYLDDLRHYRVCSLEQCSVPWHQKSLWQPSAACLETFEAAVLNNRLRLGQSHQHSNFRADISSLNSGQVVEPQLLYNLADPAPNTAKEQPFQRLLETQKGQIEQLSNERIQLIQVLQKTRDTIKHQIKLRAEAAVSRKNEELKRRVEQLSHDVQEQHSRERELLQEIAMLEQQNQYLVDESETLSRLEILGVRLQLSLSGEGQISIPFTHVDRFTQSPQQYFSELYQLELPQVELWWQHAQNPRCQHVDADNSHCQKIILVEQSPKNFQPQLSNRCEAHKLSVERLNLAQ